jgi:hypothetical protein
MLGEPERDQACHHGLGWKTHQFADFPLTHDDHRCHHPSESRGARGKEDAPAKRVDRRPTDQGVAVEIPVNCCKRAKVRNHEHQDRHLVDVLRESPLASGIGKLRGVRTSLSFSVAVGDRCPGNETSSPHRQVLVPAVEVEVAELTPDHAILHDHNPPPLPVATARSEPCIVEYLHEQIVGYGNREELTGGARRTESFDQVHNCTVPVRGPLRT